MKSNGKFVVTGNYFDRNSPKKWLIREDGQEPQQATAFKFIKADNIVFSHAGAVEQSLGCCIAANCESATGFNKPGAGDEMQPNLVRVHFADILLSVFMSGPIKVETMYLDDQGGIWIAAKVHQFQEA